ncbi:MAG: ABC transporter substrate-binding protein [Nitrososphaerota archaeon]|nr:ABC transporter substrate-binding protein [Candidatus Calditenuaceae archaeon]MDW8072898.1 ABC transporter substrate-binding protein [Nitrososphaerota archaeon]
MTQESSQKKGGRRVVAIAVAVVLVAVIVAAVLMMNISPIGPAQPPQERLLRVSFANVPYMDPAVGSDEASSVYFLNVYDTLVYPNKDGTVRPHLAESWEVSGDGLVWTFRLRQGVKFHSGRELKAEDVVFSLKRMITIGEGYGYLFKPYVDLEKTRAIDDRTLQIVLTKPFGPFLITLVRLYIVDSQLVRQHIADGPYGDMGDYGKSWMMTGEQDAGSGPYRLLEHKRGESVTLVKFDGYWGDMAQNAPTKVIMYGFTEPTTIRTMMEKRQLEVTDQWQPLENYDAMDKIEGVEIARVPSAMIFYIMLHTRKPPTDDVHVRRAIALAFDYETAIRDVMPFEKRPSGPVPSMLPGADLTRKPLERNVEAAKAELRKSKYWGQLDQYPIEFWWIAEVPWEERVALLFKLNMEEIGLKVNVVKVPWLSVVEGMTRMETTPNAVSIFVIAHYAEAGSILMSRYHSEATGTWEQGEWLMNPEIDKMIEEALATVDFNQRIQKYYEIQRKLDEISPSVYVYEHVVLRAFQASYVDYPAARGEILPIAEYELDFRWFQVFPERIPR